RRGVVGGCADLACDAEQEQEHRYERLAGGGKQRKGFGRGERHGNAGNAKDGDLSFDQPDDGAPGILDHPPVSHRTCSSLHGLSSFATSWLELSSRAPL